MQLSGQSGGALSPEPETVVWAVTDLASVPPGSMLIHPQVLGSIEPPQFMCAFYLCCDPAWIFFFFSANWHNDGLLQFAVQHGHAHAEEKFL